MVQTSRLTNIRDRPPHERRAIIEQAADLSEGVLAPFAVDQGLDADGADQMVENAVGVLAIPVGVATNFIIDGVERLVPMATEEPSVVAAASNAARIARRSGGFHTSSTAPLMQAQVQVLEVPDPYGACQRVLAAREDLLAQANALDTTLVSFGGGARDLSARVVETRVGTHVVVHLVVDVRDAMGANTVNTMAEALAPRIGELSGGRPLLRILTNKADLRLVRATATLAADELGGAHVVSGMAAASALAEADPYRAATHNKGIMNGITAVALATGNDTRAIEAGAHSHAITASGRYTSLSHFEPAADGGLTASLELPMAVGVVGGATKVHPTARAALRLMHVEQAADLAQIMVAVGLGQNIAALRVLATEGVQRGHMALHARRLAAGDDS